MVRGLCQTCDYWREDREEDDLPLSASRSTAPGVGEKARAYVVMGNDMPEEVHLDLGSAEARVAELKGLDDPRIYWRAWELPLKSLSAAPASPSLVEGWRPISEAKKDGSTIWAKLRDDIHPTLRPQRDDLRTWNGLEVPLRHPGLAKDGFDLGWNVALPVGNGGFPDEWIAGWVPLRAAPPTEPNPDVRALVEALTPSAETKAAYIGEFKFSLEQYDAHKEDWVFAPVTVPWDTVKEIMAAILKRARAQAGE